MISEKNEVVSCNDRKRKIKVGLGFITGRKSFLKVLNAHISSWKEYLSRNSDGNDVSLSLFVVYDLKYFNTKISDYTNFGEDITNVFDNIVFPNEKDFLENTSYNMADADVTNEELTSVFGIGYAGRRNMIVYSALKMGMDYLLFLDDDEYPISVTNNNNYCLWSGQYILPCHLKAIKDCDITNGHHCGYISPIPQIKFDDTLAEHDFQSFIEAISNDIINWDSIHKLMESGGVTYADADIIRNQCYEEVLETNGCKFISGANLCINLTSPQRTFPFYNPTGARGEDTFLSTMLSERKVVRIPCYAFHDGFSTYGSLLNGVLPIQLDVIGTQSETVVARFLKACIGWVRYKPLITYITHPQEYAKLLQATHDTLLITLPKLSSHFKNDKFMDILTEFDKYASQVEEHNRYMMMAKATWRKLIKSIDKKIDR